MKRGLVLSLAGIAAVALAATAEARPNNPQSITGTVNIAWPADPGTTAPIIATLDLPEVLSIKSITIQLAHTWGNDLDIYVDAPGFGLFDFDLMFVETAIGGSGNFDLGVVANNSTLANVADYTWVGAGPNNWIAPHSPSGTYNANSWINGPIGAGTYTLHIGDTIGGDGGAVGTWTIVYNPIPGPGALALLGLAGLVGTRRRRA